MNYTPNILSVDGGKSKTICLIADSRGRVIGWGRAGSSDKYYVTLDQALAAVTHSAQQALQLSGAHQKEITCGCFGLAGADWPEDFLEIETALTDLQLAQKIIVKNDAQLALRANFEKHPGVALVAGTHLAAAVRGAKGEEWHSGWFSVEGAGGIRTGYLAFWAVLKAADGRGAETALTPSVLTAAGVSRPEDMLRALSKGEYSDDFYASLAPLVFKTHAQTGDEVAADIIRHVGKDISQWGTSLIRRFNLPPDETNVVLCGGMFRAPNPLLTEIVSSEIHTQYPWARVSVGNREPVIGGLFYAYESIGLDISVELIHSIESTMPEEGFFRTS